jgi:cell division protein FtsI/penicillin-binding protein 2
LKKEVKSFQPESRRIVKESTAKQVRELLRGVVQNGTGVEADLPGYGVAGKTGTAQKPDPDGGYMENQYIVSFVGFAPYDKPEVVVYVAIDEPSSSKNATGGTVAAPIAREIMKKSLQIRQVQPNDKFAETIK